MVVLKVPNRVEFVKMVTFRFIAIRLNGCMGGFSRRQWCPRGKSKHPQGLFWEKGTRVGCKYVFQKRFSDARMELNAAMYAELTFYRKQLGPR